MYCFIYSYNTIGQTNLKQDSRIERNLHFKFEIHNN